MLRTADGELLDLAPWRMRRLVRLMADARRYPPGTPPQMLVNDLRQLVARARRVSTQPRTGLARFEVPAVPGSAADGTGACCRACLLARQQRGVLSLVGMSISPATPAPWPGHLSEATEDELRRILPKTPPAPRSVNTTLQWKKWESLQDAASRVSGAGIYLFTRSGASGRDPVPFYVGRSDWLPARLRTYAWYQRALGCPSPTVWTAGTAPGLVASAIEHALLLWLDRALPMAGNPRPKSAAPLNNQVLTDLVKVGNDGFRIANAMPGPLRAWWPPDNLIRFSKGEQFEVGFGVGYTGGATP